MTDSSVAAWSRLPRELAAALAPEVGRVQGRIVALIDAEEAWARRTGSAKVRADLDAATAAVVSRFVDLIGTTAQGFTGRDRARFRELGAGEAREGRGLEDLLAAYRIGTRVLYGECAQALSRLDPSPDVQVALGEAVFALIDVLQAESADGYAHELSTHAGERERRLGRLADALFAGEADEVRTVAALVGWAVPSRLAVAVLPAEAVPAARAALGAGGFVVDSDGAGVAVVDGDQVERAVPRLAAACGPAAGAVRVGPVVPAAQAGRSLLLATLMADVPGDEPRWAVAELPELLTRAAPEVAATLREQLLAPLAPLRAGQRARLVATLASWLRHWGQRTDIAAELSIHPQTVAYRVNQLREVFGDDLGHPTWRLAMQLALLAAPLD